MSAILAILSSLLWGSADFLGGRLSRKFQAFAVTGLSQTIGLITGLLLVLITGGWIAPNLSWNGYFLSGVIAGVVGFVGLICYYLGLATGRMGVVAPLSSLSAVIPLIYAFSRGEKPHAVALVGMLIALLGAFFASGPDIVGGLPTKPILLGLATAFCFGISLTFIAKGSQANPLMTMTTMRVSSVSICLIAALYFRWFRKRGGFTRVQLPTLIMIGVGDFLANYMLGIATTKGLVSVAMVLGSLFPIVTAYLAYRYLHEKLHLVQYLGILFAVSGVALISIA